MGKNGGETWETSYPGCIMRRVLRKEMAAGGRFDFFLDSGTSYIFHCTHAYVRKFPTKI